MSSTRWMLISEHRRAADAGSTSVSRPPIARQAATGCSQTDSDSRCTTRSINTSIWGHEETIERLLTLFLISSNLIRMLHSLKTFRSVLRSLLPEATRLREEPFTAKDQRGIYLQVPRQSSSQLHGRFQGRPRRTPVGPKDPRMIGDAL